MEKSSPELRAWLVQACRPSLSLAPDDESSPKMCVCALRAFQADEYVDSVRTHAGRPILSSYSSDATPQSVAFRIRRPESAGNIQRAGRSTSDFLLQTGILKSFNNRGDIDVAVLSHPPVPMSFGKKRWHALKAYERFAPTLLELQHTGFIIMHFPFDRGSVMRWIVQCYSPCT